MFKTIKRILDLSGRNKKRVYAGIVCSFFNSLFTSLNILAILIILININELTKHVIMSAFWVLLTSVLGKCITKYLMNNFLSATGYMVFCDQRLKLGDKFKKAPMGYFSEQNLGTISNTVTTSMLELENYAMMGIENIVGGVVQGLLVSIFLFFFDWRLGLVSLAGLVISSYILMIIQKRSRALAPKKNEAVNKTTTAVLEYVRGIGIIKSFGKDSDNGIKDVFEENADSCIALEKSVMGVNGSFRLVLEIASGLILLCASWLFLKGEFDFGVAVMFIVSSFMIYGQMETMGNGAFLMQILGNSLDKMDEVYNVPVFKSGNSKIPENKCDIELENVSFKYDDSYVLKNISFKIPEGSKCAIVGYSGSGKTTLCNLIVRFWDVSDGYIKFAGKNIKKYDPDDLMSNFSMVFQDVYLFNDTIEKNIKFGKPDASDEEMIEASKKACCHDFISQLPDGYQTIVGEGGCSLSGGEKQRISIARAILKDSPIVILDEATSSIDPENEAELMAAINELTKGKTLISIAHKMNSVKNADNIIVLDAGEISQQGTHEELKDKEGIYKNFLNVRINTSGWKL